MKKSFLEKALQIEEKQSTLIYFALFYSIGVIYHIFYYYFYSSYIHNDYDHVKFNILLIPYIIFTLLIPVFLVLLKSSKIFGYLKFILVGIFIMLLATAELIAYKYTGVYDGGNIVEIFMVIFSPIFVSSAYFWFVAGILFFKYLLVILIDPSLLSVIIFPLGSILFIVAVGYLILRRFLSHVKTISYVYNRHFQSMVKGIIAMLELKDPHTRGHSERVAKYSLVLARKLKMFSEQELTTFYYSCLLHDIGKIQISDDILTKPDILTDEEYEVVKMHTIFGAESIKDIESLEPCIEIIRHHHERWDGTGYPDKLKGEEIPLLTRIASIADAFDAMTSHRSYRAALTPDEAYSRIIRGGGTQFDPDLIPYFKHVFPAWLTILHDYQDVHEKEYNSLYSIKEVN